MLEVLDPVLVFFDWQVAIIVLSERIKYTNVHTVVLALVLRAGKLGSGPGRNFGCASYYRSQKLDPLG